MDNTKRIADSLERIAQFFDKWEERVKKLDEERGKATIKLQEDFKNLQDIVFQAASGHERVD